MDESTGTGTGKSKGKRWLIGCGLGCLVLIVLIISAVVAFSVWIGGESELLEPHKLLGADTTGYLEWSLELEDEGTAGFADALIESIQGLPPEAADDMPPWLSGWIENQQSKDAQRNVEQIFPMVVAWTLRPGEDPADDLHLISLSIKRFGNRLVFGDWLMGWFLGRSDEVEIVRHRNEKIYKLSIRDETSATFFIRGGNIFFTSDLQTARTAVDRLSETSPSREPNQVDQLYGETGGTLRGAIDNRHGELLRVWETIAALTDAEVDPELWNGFTGLSISGGLEADGSLAATLRFHGDKAWIETRALDLVMALYDGFSWNDREADVQARPFDDGLAVEVTIPDLPATLGGWIRFDRRIETDSGSIRIDL